MEKKMIERKENRKFLSKFVSTLLCVPKFDMELIVYTLK
jgi:hypothetical protein